MKVPFRLCKSIFKVAIFCLLALNPAAIAFAGDNSQIVKKDGTMGFIPTDVNNDGKIDVNDYPNDLTIELTSENEMTYERSRLKFWKDYFVDPNGGFTINPTIEPNAPGKTLTIKYSWNWGIVDPAYQTVSWSADYTQENANNVNIVAFFTYNGQPYPDRSDDSPPPPTKKFGPNFPSLGFDFPLNDGNVFLTNSYSEAIYYQDLYFGTIEELLTYDELDQKAEQLLYQPTNLIPGIPSQGVVYPGVPLQVANIPLTGSESLIYFTYSAKPVPSSTTSIFHNSGKFIGFHQTPTPLPFAFAPITFGFTRKLRKRIKNGNI